MLMVSITQPRITWNMDQVNSPSYRLCRDKTSFQLAVSAVYKVWNTLFIVWNKVCWRWCRLWLGPWDIPRRRSIKTSIQALGFTMVKLRQGFQLNPNRYYWKGGEYVITNASTRSYILCLRDGWLQCRAALDRSTNFYVAVHNMGVKCFHSMGRLSGIATRFSMILSEVKPSPAWARPLASVLCYKTRC